MTSGARSTRWPVWVLGLENASEFDPAAFDIERVNREFRAVGSPR